MVEMSDIVRQLLELLLSYTTFIVMVNLVVEHNMQKAGMVIITMSGWEMP